MAMAAILQGRGTWFDRTLYRGAGRRTTSRIAQTDRSSWVKGAQLQRAAGLALPISRGTHDEETTSQRPALADAPRVCYVPVRRASQTHAAQVGPTQYVRRS